MIISVIGIGQSLRGDDGIGPEAVRRWSDRFPEFSGHPRLRTHILETPGLELLDYLLECEAAILVDAVSTGSAPGSIHVFDPIPNAALTPAEKTAHGFGVAETISLARQSGANLPARLILIGIEGKQYDLGRGLSKQVLEALPIVVQAIRERVSQLLSTKDTKNTK